MRRPGVALSIALAVALVGAGLSAQEAPAGAEPATAKPARELVTTGAGVTDTGVLVLNAGVQRADARDDSSARRFPLQLALGVTPWLDVRVAWSGPNHLVDADGTGHDGPGDPLFGGQLQFLRQDAAGLDLGLAYWHKLPRASVAKGIGTGKADDTLVLAASHGAGPWQFDVNAGGNWLGRTEDSGRIRQGLASAAVTRALAPGWSASLEASLQAGSEAGPRAATGLLAVSRDLGAELTVDLGIEAGLSQSAERFAVDAGVVWRMAQLWGGK
jgi:hypothetical protein